MSHDVPFNSAVSDRAFDAIGSIVNLLGALVVASGGCASGGGVALLEEQLDRWRGATRGCESIGSGGQVGVGFVCSSCSSVDVDPGRVLGTAVDGVEGGVHRVPAAAGGEGVVESLEHVRGDLACSVGSVSVASLKQKAKKARRRQRKAAEKAGFSGVREPLVEPSVVRNSVVGEVDEVPEWRRKKLFTRSDFMRQGPVPRTAKARGEEGYFSACASEVRQALRDSRAKMLIAKNEAEAAKYLNVVNAADGVMGRSSDVVDYLMEVKKVVGVVGGLKKSAEVAKIGGWVQTVIDSALSDVSSRKPSSVPALDLKSVSSLGSVSVSGEERLVEGKDVVTLKDLTLREKLERMRLFTDVFEEEVIHEEREGIAVRIHAMVARGVPEDVAYQPACSGADVETAVQTYYRNLAKERPLTKYEVRFRDNVKAVYTKEQHGAMAAAASFEEMEALLVEFDG